MLFRSHYEKVVYLAQTDDERLKKEAVAAAKRLGLAYEYRFVGLGELAPEITAFAEEPLGRLKRKRIGER